MNRQNLVSLVVVAAVTLAAILIAIIAITLIEGCAETAPYYEPLSLEFETEGSVRIIGGEELDASLCLDHSAVAFTLPFSASFCYFTLPGDEQQHCSWLRVAFPGGIVSGVIPDASTAECVEALGEFSVELGTDRPFRPSRDE
jgi:hypothetical protein